VNPEDLGRAAGAYRLAQAIHTAAALRVADHLVSGTRTAAELAAAAGAAVDPLQRLMDALAGEGVFDQSDDGHYSLNDVSRQLVSGQGLGAMILGWIGLPTRYRAYGRLTDAVRGAGNAMRLEFGTGFHEHLAATPEEGEAYDAAMESTVESFESAVASYDFDGIVHVVDIGGGGGSLDVCLLRRYPQLTATVMDLPGVIAAARRRGVPADVASRLELVNGDFFTDAIPAADAYVFSTVLRMLDDDGAVRLLSRVRASMPGHARVLALDFLHPAGPLPSPLGLADLDTMVVYGGRDRDVAEFSSVLERSGLRLHATAAADFPFSWIDARVA